MIDFELPDELIAQKPASPRDSARLLVYVRKDKRIIDAVFSDLMDYLPPESTLVLNNSKVENCRWLFNGGKIEVFTLEKLDTHTVRAMVRPGKRFKLGASIDLAPGITAKVTDIDDTGLRTLKLNVQHDDDLLKEFEHIPLPPYIKQNDDLADEYQTVYADPLGSKAAPTAGLHFTDALLDKARKTCYVAEVTLHVGLGTFAPLTPESIAAGKLHSESYYIDDKNLMLIKNAKRTVTVGTTTTRTLESLAKTGKQSGSTDIFIQPGYEFKYTDSMITNFHLPGTSLLMMVEALVGSETEMQRIYDHAISQRYRFYSFGDAMLIL